MSGKTQALEHEIAEMENRLANVKVKVEIERDAWKKSYRTGKKGTKWKSAAGAQASKTPPSESSSSAAESKSTRDLEANETIMPSYWDALELAQYLQTRQLTAFAQVVIYEQITGKALLDTPPGKMRQLFQDVIASNTDPNWKIFLQIISKLHKLQKKLEKSSNAFSGRSESKEGAGHDPTSPMSPRGAPTIFPLISPRMPSLTATSIKTSVVQDADDRDNGDKRRMKTAMPLRKPPVNGQQLATCWNCGTRFPRSQGSVRGGGSNSSKALSTRTFCSKECQSAIENTDISISSSFSASLQVSSARDPKDFTSHPHGVLPNKSRPFHKPQQQKSKSETNGPPSRQSMEGLSDFLQVAHRGSADEVPRPPVSSSSGKPNGTVLRKRIVGAGGSSPSVASISSSQRGELQLSGSIQPLTLTSFNDPFRQSKAYQQSKYKLDPDIFQAKALTFAACFYNGAAASGASFTRKNLMKLQEFISVKTLHRLSLTSRSWFEAIHQSSLADPLWGFHLLRTWKRSDEDEAFLHEIGALTMAKERPRQMMITLTKKVGKIVLENMKVLYNPENWHLATPMSSHPSVTLQSVLRSSLSPPPLKAQVASSSAPISASMFEQIALIYNRKCEVVAVRIAQELIRPVADDQMLTAILHGMRSGSLLAVECRRLRLFSAANRLPFDDWHALSQCRNAVFDFFWSSSLQGGVTSESPIPRVWHQRVFARMQKAMQQRLLGRDSVQQVLRAVSERNGPPQVLVALEKFLTGCHAAAVKTTTHAGKEKKEILQQSPSAKTQ